MSGRIPNSTLGWSYDLQFPHYFQPKDAGKLHGPWDVRKIYSSFVMHTIITELIITRGKENGFPNRA
jgi:hypothetical protein